MINVFIADDHPIVRNGLKQIITDEKDMKVCCEASNSEELFEQLKKCVADVIVLDISMPGESGLDALARLRRLNNKTPVLVLSALPEELYAKRSVEAGAAGFMNKECASDELVIAIKKVYSGGKYISSKFAEKLAEDLLQKDDKKPHEYLSQREFQIFLKIACGKKISKIAEMMNLSVNTISTYRKRILQKMNFSDNSEIMSYCLREKLIN